MTYHVEVEEMERKPQPGSVPLVVTLQTRMFESAQPAVTFARESIRDYAGAELPRAFVRSHHEKGRRKGHSDLIFTAWRNFAGKITERRRKESAL